MRKTLFSAMVVLSIAAAAWSQPFVTGLTAPTRMTFTPQGNLIVAEAGTTAKNSGRVSLVDRTNRTRRTFIDGLPSGVSGAGAEAAPSGPAGVALRGATTAFVVIGAGDGVLPGPAPGTELPNPTPASPILSSLLSLQSSVPLDLSTGGFTLLPSDHTRLKDGETVTLTNATGQTLAVKLVADFPNHTPSPRPDLQTNVRAGNPFGVAVRPGTTTVYVVDASQNVIRRVDSATGAVETLTTFGPIPNPLPFGPPMIDAVPDSLAIRGNELLVTTLTGFPFPPGRAEVARVNLATGERTTYVGGLTSAIDVHPLGPGANDPVAVLEFSTNMTQSAPGQLRMAAPGGAPTVLASNLPTPTSIAVDPRSGEIFIAHIFPGFITRVSAAGVIPAAPPTAIVPVVASLPGALGSRYETSMQIGNPHPFAISGRLVVHPQGQSGAVTDPAVAYTLAPFETRTFANFMTAAGATGGGSVDVIAAVGSAPVIVTTIADVASGDLVQVPAVTDALTVGMRGTLVAPAAGRFSIGVRTLSAGATLTFTAHDAAGAVLRTTTRTFPADYFHQFSASELLGGAAASVSITVDAGSAIVYGVAPQGTLQVARGTVD